MTKIGWYHIASIYMLALGLLLMNTLPTNGLIGTDSHLELYFAQLAMDNGWNPLIPHPGNAALSSTLLAPSLSAIMGIPLLWVFKMIYPIIFATVPVVLYFVWSKYMTRVEALLSAVFFILIPTFAQEITGIGRQQVAELLLAVYVLVLLIRMRVFHKVGAMIALGILVSITHYSLGVVLLIITGLYLVWVGVYWLVAKIKRVSTWAWRRTQVTPAILLTTCLVIVGIGSVVYWGWAGGGTPLRYMAHLIPIEETQLGPYKIGRIPGSSPTESGSQPNNLAVSGKPAKNMSINNQEYDALMKIALGMDFTKASVQGKLFRILQYLTQIGIVIGGVWLVASRRVRKPYKIAAMCGLSILGICVIMPVFASILNATRWYHLASFLMAPLLIFAFTRVIKKPVLLVVLLMAYGLFSTGVMFEILKVDNIATPDMPYSLGLSGQRIGIIGNNTDDDKQMRSWLKQSDVTTIYADIRGNLFLQETMAIEKNLYTWRGPFSLDELKGDVLFLSSSNTINNKFVSFAGIGTRIVEEFDMSEFDVVHSIGTSMIVRRNDDGQDAD